MLSVICLFTVLWFVWKWKDSIYKKRTVSSWWCLFYCSVVSIVCVCNSKLELLYLPWPTINLASVRPLFISLWARILHTIMMEQWVTWWYHGSTISNMIKIAANFVTKCVYIVTQCYLFCCRCVQIMLQAVLWRYALWWDSYSQTVSQKAFSLLFCLKNICQF